MKIRLTRKVLDTLPAGWHHDDQVQELWVYAGKNGCTWYHICNRNYTRVRTKIGSAAVITREDAVASCRKVSYNLETIGRADGPGCKPEDITLGDAYAMYAADRRAAEKTPLSHCHHLDRLYNHKIWQISRTDVIRLRDDMADHKVMANRVISCLRTVYEYLIREGLTDSNPARKIAAYHEQPRRRYLTQPEAVALIDALNGATEHPRSRNSAHALLLMVYTWKRIGNVIAMRWEEIDLERRVWTIPAAKAKARRTIDAVLSAEAVAILQQRAAECDRTGYVFPSAGKTGHIDYPRRVWRSALRAAGIADAVHRHDIRHTMATWALRSGVPLATVSDQLDHRDVSFTARTYAHVMLESKREAVESAITAITSGLPD